MFGAARVHSPDDIARHRAHMYQLSPNGSVHFYTTVVSKILIRKYHYRTHSLPQYCLIVRFSTEVR